MVREMMVKELVDELKKNWFGEQLDAVGEYVIELGYRRERYGKWIYDESYTGKSKDVFVCSACGHWQSSKKRSDNIFYMNYCPFCGARMEKPEQDKTLTVYRK